MPREVLVLMDRSLLPEGRGSKSLCAGWEGSATIFPLGCQYINTLKGSVSALMETFTFDSFQKILHLVLDLIIFI